MKHFNWLIELQYANILPSADNPEFDANLNMPTDKLFLSNNNTPINKLSTAISTEIDMANVQSKIHTNWKPMFCALSDRDLLLYDTAPITKEEWANPVKAHPLIATRLVQNGIKSVNMKNDNYFEESYYSKNVSNNTVSSTLPSDMVTFSTRTG